MNKRPLDFKVVTLVDAFVIFAPLLLLFFILLFEGQAGSIWDKSEWSFVTVFYLVETLRDQVVRLQKGGYHIKQVEAGVVFYSIVLVLGVLVLNLDFKHSIGESNLSSDSIYIAKFGMFIISISLFTIHRFIKYKLNKKELEKSASEAPN